MEKRIKNEKDNQKILNDQINDNESIITSLNNQLKNLKENFEIELKEKKKMEDKFKNLNNSVKGLINKMFIMFKEEASRCDAFSCLKEKIDKFFNCSLNKNNEGEKEDENLYVKENESNSEIKNNIILEQMNLNKSD
jgi:hypothetical protein